MKKILIKFIAVILAVSFFAPISGLEVKAANTPKAAPLILRKNESAKAPVLDLKDAKDIKGSPALEAPGQKETGGIGQGAKAVIKSFKIEDPSDKKSELPKSSSQKLLSEPAAVARPLETGIAWIKNNQNSAGSWSKNEKTEIVDTSAVFAFLKRVEEIPSFEYQKAVDWFGLTFPENSDYLAEKVISLAGIDQDISYLADFLASQINEQNFGFGYQKNYQSDIITTAKVLKAINASDYSDSWEDGVYTLKGALQYLLLFQNSDGGWPKVRNGQSDIKTTALVLEALRPYRTYILGGTPQGEIVIRTKIDLGINYLKNKQNPDGSWQDVEGTAKVYDALLNYRQYPNYNQQALNYLLFNQNEDGSFANQNIYATSKALQAIAKPDIAVTSIQNTSGTIPNEPTAVEIAITNAGYNKSQNINFKAKPGAFHLFADGKELALEYEQEHPDTITLEPRAALILDAVLLNLPFGPHTVEFFVDYEGIELDKENNKKTAEFIFDNPEFTGPEPPPWVGARTTENPLEINISWQFSEDPQTAHYYLYFGASPGNYAQYFDISGNYNTVSLFGFPSGVRYYFAVASVDRDNVRGDYSMETSAAAWSDPDSHLGVIPISVKDNNQSLLYGVNLIFFGFGYVNTENLNPAFIETYPGNYWVTAEKNGYQAASRAIENKAGQNAENAPTENFTLNIIDNGLAPAAIQNLRVQPGDGQIILNWDRFNDSSGDFRNFNIYRTFSEIEDVSRLTPFDNFITDPTVVQFLDDNIVNGVDYYYAVTVVDRAGNENRTVTGIGPVRGNSAPTLSNVAGEQDYTGQVKIKYDLKDNEQTEILIRMEYWDGTGWQEAVSISGAGLQNVGAERILTWNPKTDYPGYDGSAKIRITADDRESVNNISSLESGEFSIDTISPTNSSVNVVGGEKCTGSLVVDLNLYADGGSLGIAEMRFSNDANLDGIADQWSEWEPYATLKNKFILTENANVRPGNERIIVEFKDKAGNTAQTFKDIFRYIPSDTNRDCKINVLDLIFVRNRLNQDVSVSDNWRADVNADGKINIIDLIVIRNKMGSGAAADEMAEPAEAEP